MLKVAFQLGVKRAYEEEEGLTPQQMAAAQRLSGIGGGLAGSAGGGLLGKYLGGRAAETFSDKGFFGGVDPQKIERGQLIGTLLGSLAGGGVGGYAGAQVPKWLNREAPAKHRSAAAQPIADQAESETSLGLLPEIYGMTPDNRMRGAMGLDNFYPEY
jgi:hypothetical protein